MKSIILVETFWHGHHSMHFKFYTKTLLELGYQVTALCPNPTELKVWIAKNLPEQTQLLQSFELQEPKHSRFPIGRIRRTLITLARWRNAAATIQETTDKSNNPPNLIFFPALDPYIAPYLTHHIVDAIFPYNWLGLYHDPFHLRIKQPLEFLRRGLLNPDSVLYSPLCLGIAVHDEGVIKNLQHKINSKPVVAFPNTVDESAPDPDFSIVKQIQEKARGRKIIGLFGSQGKRKGILTLLEVAQKSVKENWFFVFAGGFVPESFLPEELKRIQEIIKSQPDNCFFHFEHIPGEPQFNALINASDVLYIVNEDYPSNSQILTLAAIFEKPVIGNDQFCIGERVYNFQLGIGIPEKNTAKCLEALHRLLDGPDFISKQLQPNFKNYSQLHSYEQLGIAFKTLLDTV